MNDSEFVKGIDFRGDDFKGAVILTVDEATELMKHLDLCEYWLTNNDICYDCDKWATLLEKRIERVVMNNDQYDRTG